MPERPTPSFHPITSVGAGTAADPRSVNGGSSGGPTTNGGRAATGGQEKERR